jgi:hypothetical protein
VDAAQQAGDLLAPGLGVVDGDADTLVPGAQALVGAGRRVGVGAGEEARAPALRAQARRDLDQQPALAEAALAVEEADGAGGAVRVLAPGEESAAAGSRAGSKGTTA